MKLTRSQITMLENIGNTFRHAHDLNRATRISLHKRGLIEERFPLWWYITDKGTAALSPSREDEGIYPPLPASGAGKEEIGSNAVG